jgi:hypothetical protein
MLRWSVPVWSIFACIFLAIALTIQRVVARSQELPRPLRPLTLTSLAVAVMITVLVLCSGAPSDRWFLLAWLVPATTTVAEKIWPRLPNATLAGFISCLLAVVIVGQLVFIWRARNEQQQANSFHDQLSQLCTDTDSRSSGGRPGWIAGNEWMIAQLQTLTPSDERTRELTGYLIVELQGSEASLKLDDPIKHAEWQQAAREVAGYLGINQSCGVF